MAGVGGRNGGRRTGAGRPFKTEGCATVVMRMPSYMKESIETLIRVQAEWLSEDEKSQPIGYLNEAEEKRRRRLIQDLEAVVSYEKNRLVRAYQLKLAEEEDRRQLKLF